MSTNNNIKALKSGVWYTVANFITKSMGFFITPIFSRLLSHNEFGLYSNYVSWQNTFMVFVTLNLGATFISARYDYEEDFDGYVSSMLVLSTIIVGIWVIIINLFPERFHSFTGIEIEYLNIMLIYLLLYSAVDMFQVREQYYFQYKNSVIISLLVAVCTAVLSVVLASIFRDRFLGRVLGGAVPTIIIGMVLYTLLILKGKKISLVYWKYALPICIPYIPHTLSLTLLNAMDKLMITRICGAEDNALYSLAYSCGAVITLLMTSLNTAFSPWLGEKLQKKKYGEIKNMSIIYVTLFSYLTCGILLMTPELLWIMGGKSYLEAKYVMPPVALGCVCQFIYTMYVNIEQFEKKTVGMAFATIFAALSNFILNSIFIPQIGYIAAAYTTLISFLILLFIHMLLVKKIGLSCVYSTKNIIGILCIMTGYVVLLHLLYAKNFLRYVLIILYIISLIVLANKYKTEIKQII